MITDPQSDYYAMRSEEATLAGNFAGLMGRVCLSRSREASLAHAPAASRTARGTNGTNDGGLPGHRWIPGLQGFGGGHIEDAKDRTTVGAGIASGGRTL